MRNLSNVVQQLAEVLQELEPLMLPPFTVEIDSTDRHVQINFHLDENVPGILEVMRAFPNGWSIWIIPIGLWISLLYFLPEEMSIIARASGHAINQVIDLIGLAILTGAALIVLIWLGLIFTAKDKK